MSPECWQEAKGIFFEALELDPAAREGWLAGLTDTSSEILTAVRRMLYHERSTGQFLAAPPEIPADLIDRLTARPSFQPSDIVAGRFVILQKLGQGGMGEVFEAEDRLLRERVAVKTVLTEIAWDETAHRQLQREVQLARQVSHPNVCRIHEIFFHYSASEAGEIELPVLSMELLHGCSLSAWLKEHKPALPEARAIAAPLADALAAAHSAGVVHGDFKPANIFLVPNKSGLRPVVTDFGLSRGLTDTTQTLQVLRSAMAGTPPYMAPEQFEGAAPNPATDVYSFGLVLFELLAGQAAYPPTHTVRDLANQALRTPPAIRQYCRHIDARLEQIVQKCLEREPSNRYSSGVELRAAFQEKPSVARRAFFPVAAGLAVGVGAFAIADWRRLGSERGQRSIAILPFKNSDENAAEDYLVNGITAEVRRCVERIPKLRVVGRDSSQVADSVQVSFTQLGRQLSVTHVLTGAVRASERRLLSRVQLFDARTSLPVMNKLFESTAKAAISLEIEIAEAIAVALKLEFSRSARVLVARGQTAVPEAYELYLHGNQLMTTRDTRAMERAGDLYVKSLQLDPEFALGWAALANQRNSLAGHPGYLWNEVVPEAERYALKARELAPDAPEVLCQLGQIESRYRLNWIEAARYFEIAVRTNPNYVDGLNHLAGIYSLLKQHDRAIDYSSRAVSLDPLSVRAQNSHAYYLRNAHRFSEAATEVEKAIRLNPDFQLSYIVAANIYGLLNNWLAARNILEKAISKFDDLPELSGYLAITLAKVGDRSNAERLASELEKSWKAKPFWPSTLADMYCGLGATDRMYEWVNTAIREHDPNVTSIAVDPNYDPYRTDPRFRAALRQLNLS